MSKFITNILYTAIIVVSIQQGNNDALYFQKIVKKCYILVKKMLHFEKKGV